MSGTLPTITHDLNAGSSWGLEFPIIFGFRPELLLWCAWNRHTGEVVAAMRPIPNAHGHDHAEELVKRYSMPQGYNQSWVDHDSET